MSVSYSAEVWKSTLPAREKMVVLALAWFANDKGESWPSIRALSAHTSLSERQVQRLLRDLEDGGFITVDRGKGRGHVSVYRLSKSLPTAIGKGDMAGEKGDADDTLCAGKGDAHDTITAPEKVTPGVKKVTRPTPFRREKVTWGAIKGDMGVTQKDQETSDTATAAAAGDGLATIEQWCLLRTPRDWQGAAEIADHHTTEEINRALIQLNSRKRGGLIYISELWKELEPEDSGHERANQRGRAGPDSDGVGESWADLARQYPNLGAV